MSNLQLKQVTKEHYPLDDEAKSAFTQKFNLNFSDLQQHFETKIIDGRSFLQRKFDGIARFQHSNGNFFHYNLESKQWGNGKAY